MIWALSVELLSFGSKIYLIFIPIIFGIYLSISWGIHTEIEEEDLPGVKGNWLIYLLPNKMRKNFFLLIFYPGYIIVKFYRDLAN